MCSTRELEPERADRCLLEATFWASGDFSDSFFTEFSEVRIAHRPVSYPLHLSEVLHLRDAATIRLLHVQDQGFCSALYPDEKREGTKV